MTDTYEWIRLRQCRHIIYDVAVGEVAIDMILTYLVQFSNLKITEKGAKMILKLLSLCG